MQLELTPKTLRRWGKYFLLGAAVELLLFTCFFAPENWLSVEACNFAMVTHYPILFLLESGLGETAVTSILTALAGFAAMSSLWGFLIFSITNAAGRFLTRLSRSQKTAVGCVAGVAGLALVVCAVISLLPQTPIPFAASAETKSVVTANNAFALDLYQKLKDQPGNLFFSPYSISAALAMTSAGAHGQTEMEMTNALHFTMPPEKLHPAFKALAGRMDSIQRWNRIVLKSANSIWCQKDYHFSDVFLKLVGENYFAEAKSVDFQNAFGAAADEINRWIDEKTNHKISNGIGPEQLAPATRLALCDAIYFKGKWLYQFKRKDTKPATFQVATNETVTVPMMWQNARFKHVMTEDNSVEMLELPYIGQDLSMVILLPSRIEYMPDAEHNDVHDLEQKLTAENLRTWLAKLDQVEPHKTSVRLPRFTTTSSFNLATELKALGMNSAFDDTADFSGMDGAKNLYLSDVFHKAFVEVNETGTEAAAVNLSRVEAASMNDNFNVDHPFVFLIRDNGSGSILFLGRIINPTK